MAITKEQVIETLRQVREPELHRDLVTLNLVKNVAYCDGHARIRIEQVTPGDGARRVLKSQIEQAVRALGDEIKQVEVEFEAPGAAGEQQPASAQQQRPGQQQQAQSPQTQQGAPGQPESNPLPDVDQIIAVGAGKGGVGKSTVAINLAVGLARQGARVGLLDGDIYGPSTPTMLGLAGMELRGTPEKNFLPFEKHGLKAITIGALVESERPLIWRGPMAHGAFRDLATRTEWGELDYLIIDLPPGTGDVPLTMAQLLPLTGAVVVCTPQKVAQDDARRAVRMFEQLNIEVLGIIENMSYFIGDDGKEYDLFGRGGAEMMAQQMGTPYLGAIPINMALRRNSDDGNPTANFEGDDQLGSELMNVVQNLEAQLRLKATSSGGGPTLSIED